MPPLDANLGPLRRARAWLLENKGFRAKLLGNIAAGAASAALLAALFLTALLRGEHGGAHSFWEWLKLAAWLLMGGAGIAGLGYSLWTTHRLYRAQLKSAAESESRARFIVEACPDAILIVDSQGMIESCNPATEAIFGYRCADLRAQKLTKLIPQRHFLFDMAAMGRENFMAFAERQNGVRFPVEISVAAAQHGGKRRFAVLVHDASERRYSDETVHHISLSVSATTGVEYVRTLVQQLSLALQTDFAFIAETGSQDDGTSFCSLTLAEQGRLRSKANYGLEGTVFAEALQQSKFTAISKGVRQQYPNDNLLATLKAEAFLATPLVDNEGHTVGLIGAINCIPATQIGIARQTLQIFAARAASEIERKQEVEGLASEKDKLAGDMSAIKDRYEDEIAAEQELLAVTLRSIREACITTDNDGRIAMLNPVAEKLTGWPQAEAADQPLSEVLQLASLRGNRPADVLRLAEKNAPGDFQWNLTSRDGTQRRVEMSIAPIRARRNVKLGTVLVLRDVTERQFIEEERQKAEKLESIGLAAGGIAHDFNNLLTAVIGNLSLSLQGSDGGGVRDRIEASKNAALRAQDLARQLLTFSKGGAPVKRTASLRQLVLDTVGFSLSGTNSRPVFELPEDLWSADVDAGQISQVIGNLAVNAVQAMAQGGTLYVRGENIEVGEHNAPPTLHPGRHVLITVRDEGPGIPEEVQKKIFDPYFTTKPTGNGLGLATSYTIIKNHDGFIGVESEPGKGAAFRIYLPASSDTESQTPEAPPEPEVKRPAKPPKAAARVLVLDDEEIICELICYTLHALGHTVIPAQDGQTALRFYREALERGQPFDLAIMDLTIPGGMGGREALEELKKMDPAVKAIVSSGYAMDPIMTRCRDFGFCAAIPKPFDIANLEEVVQQALSE